MTDSNNSQFLFLPISGIDETGRVGLSNGDRVRILECTGLSFDLMDHTRKVLVIANLMQMLYKISTSLSFTVYHALYPLEEFLQELNGCPKSEYASYYRAAVIDVVRDRNIGYYRYFISFKELSNADDITGVLQNGLHQLGMIAKPLDRDASTNLFSSILHRHRMYHKTEDYITPDDSNQRASETVRTLVGVGSYAVEEEDIRLGGNYSKSGFVAIYPNRLTAGYITDIITQPFDLLFTMHTHRVNEAEMYKEIDTKRLELQSYVLEEQKGQKLPSLKIDQANRSLEDFSNRMVSDNSSAYKTSTYFTVFSSKKETLVDDFNFMTSSFKNVVTYSADYREREAFLSSLPLAHDFTDRPKEQMMVLRGVASSIPFMVREVEDKGGIVFGLNEQTRSLLKINEWNLPNAHIVILGVSGMGKSFFMKTLLTRAHMLRGERIFLLDPNGEYRMMTNYVGGTYISRQRGGYSVNPFDVYYSDEVSSSKAIDMSISRVKMLISQISGRAFLDPTEVATLELALYNIYERFGWTRAGGIGKETPTLLDLYNLLVQMSSNGPNGEQGSTAARDLAVRLIPYATGTFSEYLAKPTNFNFNGNFIAIDYTNLPKEIKPLIVTIDFAMIMERVKQDRVRTKLVIDEGWDMLRTTAGSELILEAVKTGRKYNLSVVFATQDVQDVGNSADGVTLLQNAMVKYITTQNETGLPVIQRVFNLSDREIRVLQGAGVGGGLLIVDTERFPIRVISSALERKLFESNPLKMDEHEKEFELAKKVIEQQTV